MNAQKTTSLTMPAALPVLRSCSNLPSRVGAAAFGRLEGKYAKPAGEGWLESLDVRISSKISVTLGGCWLWGGGVQAKGYGAAWINGKRQLLHRYMYEKFRGPIPQHLECDHLCWVRRCLNANHIELVGHRENIGRQLRLVVKRLWGVRNFISETTSDNVRLVPLNLNTPYSAIGGFLIASRLMGETKSCATCLQAKPFSDFYKIKDESARLKGYSYLSSYCKPCHSARCVINERNRRAKAKGG